MAFRITEDGHLRLTEGDEARITETVPSSGISVFIGGLDFTPQYKTSSIEITEQLQNRSNTLKLQVNKLPAQTKPTEGQEIHVFDGERLIFGGFITRITPQEIGIGQLFTYEVEATDFVYILINHAAQEVYENMTLADIVADLIATYAPDWGLTLTNVDAGPTLPKVTFNHISLRKCFEKLTAYTGYQWWVDYERNIFFKPQDYQAAPEQFTDASANFEEIDISVDATQVRNSIIVQGGKEETVTYLEEIFVGNGQTRTWPLIEHPKTMVSIERDSGGGYVAQVYGVDPLDEETGNDFMFNFQEKYVRLTTGEVTPTSSEKIRVRYKYEVPVIIKVKSTSSINAMAALEGGDGVHDYTIMDPSIRSKLVARQRGLEEISENGNPLIHATVDTRTGLLLPGSYFHPGQYVTVNLPSWGITEDSAYLIQEVRTTLVEGDAGIEYNYSVRFGGRLINAATFLESLAGTETPIDADEEVDRIEVVSETVGITESIVRDANERTVNVDDVGISTTINRTNTTPPFKWMPSGVNDAKWNKFEWS